MVYQPIEPFRQNPCDKRCRPPPMLEQDFYPEGSQRHSDHVCRILRSRRVERLEGRLGVGQEHHGRGADKATKDQFIYKYI